MKARRGQPPCRRNPGKKRVNSARLEKLCLRQALRLADTAYFYVTLYVLAVGGSSYTVRTLNFKYFIKFNHKAISLENEEAKIYQSQPVRTGMYVAFLPNPDSWR